MFAFNFTAKNDSQTQVTDRVVAATYEEALATLQKAGYTDINMISNAATAINLNDDNSRNRLELTAAEVQQLQRQPRLLMQLAMLFARNVSWWGPLLVWWAIGAAMYGFTSTAALIPAALLALHILGFIWSKVPMILYNRTLEASAWHRWTEAERIMRALARWKSWFKIAIPEHEIIFRLATAEAGQGRLADGLKRAAVLKHDASLKPGFYESKLSSLYFAARDFQQVALVQHTSRKLNPGVAPTIDLATTLARRLNNFKAAELLLADIDNANLSQLERLFFFSCQGVISLNTGRPELAITQLSEAYEITAAYASMPLMQVNVTEIRTHLALALCACGRQVEANPHALAVHTMLLAWQDTAMLQRLKDALRG
ncbi:hypothetical protein H8L32_23200 [Undibacterium sp. CY18W]|uniref:Tetratricopeptide repeat protein n=1 Tax=Undibacterium hunanense TaxID=2762292 RepID=A0ABR6ZX08_9BURK|nr:hypothetical protein [Undibacterium hunanense]MBC3920390.1 hypothetical protein [Undibacterium hunanense]